MIEGLLLYFSWVWHHMETYPLIGFFLIYLWINLFSVISEVVSVPYKLKVFILITLFLFPLLTYIITIIFVCLICIVEMFSILKNQIITILKW